MQYLVPSFFTLVIVIIFARLIGFLFRKINQPSVMGEVLSGILLGPSCFGYFFPELSVSLFHPGAIVFLKAISEIGILLYLFIMGLELDLPRMRQTARSAGVISQLSIVFPFLVGIILASQIFSNYAPLGFGIVEFSLFIAVSLSITAFPVLARILADSSLHKTRLGDLALTCAAVGDITAWCLIAIVTGISNSSLSGAIFTVVLTIIYIGFMLILVKPFVEKIVPRLEKNSEKISESLLALAILGALGSAAVTDLIGIHALFGAFLFGAIIPHESLIARDLCGRLMDFVRILFLPAFFVLTGLQTRFGLLSGLNDWAVCAFIVLLAIAGKFGGTYIGGVLSGHSKHDSTILGILMNTRGLVELIVLNIGLSLGILTPTLFTMLVIMALVTTFMTGPLLNLVLNKK